MTGMFAPMVLDGPIDGDWFEAYIRVCRAVTKQATGTPAR